MDRHVKVGEVDLESRDLAEQRHDDFLTLRDDPLFDESIYLPPNSMVKGRDEAINDFLNRWMEIGVKALVHCPFRRPCRGFHPQIYAFESRFDAKFINPFAHYIRSGKPDGPWIHEVITPKSLPITATPHDLQVGLHGHFFYPELAADFLQKMACNRSNCDLLLSTDTEAKARLLHEFTDEYRLGQVVIRVVPNRGRDIGAFLTGFAEDIMKNYDIIGHVHAKRRLYDPNPAVGETWREFLWQNLLGDLFPMMDTIIQRLTGDNTIGIVFPNDPHLHGWDLNREAAENLARRMGIKDKLPPFFEFPAGTMFWARVNAMRSLFELRFSWNDYPEEPVQGDGTMLHALERLMSFAVLPVGCRFATTHVPGVGL